MYQKSESVSLWAPGGVPSSTNSSDRQIKYGLAFFMALESFR